MDWTVAGLISLTDLIGRLPSFKIFKPTFQTSLTFKLSTIHNNNTTSTANLLPYKHDTLSSLLLLSTFSFVLILLLDVQAAQQNPPKVQSSSCPTTCPPTSTHLSLAPLQHLPLINANTTLSVNFASKCFRI